MITAKTFFTSFQSHPKTVGETYLGHMAFAMRFARKLLLAGGAALLHAFIPALFETTASRILLQMSDEMRARHAHDG